MFDYQLHHIVVTWLRYAGDIIKNSFERDIWIDTKESDRDLVTEMDRFLEKDLVQRIRSGFPGHRIISEEGFGDTVRDTKGFIWTIDPIDGTMNYVKQRENFGTRIGLFYNGNPIAGYLYTPMDDKLIYGIVGEGVFVNERRLKPMDVSHLKDSILLTSNEYLLRNDLNLQEIHAAAFSSRATGASILKFMQVIEGKAATFVMPHSHVWDFAAGWAICEALGMKCTQSDGSPLSILQGSSLVVANPTVHQEVLEIINQ